MSQGLAERSSASQKVGISTLLHFSKLLNAQVHLHPSILPEDFDITVGGELVLNLPQAEDDSPYQNGHGGGAGGDNRDGGEKEVETGGESEETSYQTSGTASTLQAAETQQTKQVQYDEDFKKIIEEAAGGRVVSMIQVGSAILYHDPYCKSGVQLFKPDGKSLGFSVVGLRSEHKGELGIYVQEIQPEGIAGVDGQLKEGDQILAIDGQVKYFLHIGHSNISLFIIE